MRNLLLPVLILSACGTMDVDCNFEYTINGIYVCSEEQLDVSHANEYFRLFDDLIEERYGFKDFTSNYLQPTSIYVTNADLQMNCENIFIGPAKTNVQSCRLDILGFTDTKGTIYLEYIDPCFGIYPLGHELLHSVEVDGFGADPIADNLISHSFIPNMFTKWAIDNDMPPADTTEYILNLYANNLCFGE